MEREGTLTTPDGRTLAYVERGAADGVPVIVSHGTPGSRFARHPDPQMYERHGVRVVAYDRPGYGRSDPSSAARSADAAADIEAIADELGFERFAVVGGSGGAPHALACGALLADRVVRVGALVTPAPSDADGLRLLRGPRRPEREGVRRRDRGPRGDRGLHRAVRRGDPRATRTA